jgi:hypothetical protein
MVQVISDVFLMAKPSKSLFVDGVTTSPGINALLFALGCLFINESRVLTKLSLMVSE